MSAIKLRPCPCCGGSPEMVLDDAQYADGHVRCTGCGLRTGGTMWQVSTGSWPAQYREDIAALWNHRGPAEPDSSWEDFHLLREIADDIKDRHAMSSAILRLIADDLVRDCTLRFPAARPDGDDAAL